MAEITLRGVTKRYPDGFEAVKDDDLEIGDGEFMILVGPSGCGKSTALRMIAGLEEITDGELIIGGERVNELAPRDRDIAMVFQNYALYPHMTVRENMGFALKLAKVDQGRDRPQGRGGRAASSSSSAHLDRKPANLSGGQRQRVAMGRAIVRDPKAFLMDEPLSNLDAKLRVQMRTEVARIQHQLGTTTLYVTHDQTEAMTLGDRVAVMRAGVIQQVDIAEGALRRPGEPVRRRLHRLAGDELRAGAARGRHDQAAVRRRADAARASWSGKVGQRQDVIAGIRPEHFEDAAVGRRRAATTAEVHGQGRRRRVDGLRALRVLRGQGRGALRPARRPRRRRGDRRLPGQSGGDATAVVARLDASSPRRPASGRARARHVADQAVRPERRAAT